MMRIACCKCELLDNALAIGLLFFASCWSISAQAQSAPAATHSPWRGDITRFREQDWRTWRGGQWKNEHYGGRAGWWWVVGRLHYPYPEPVYPYPNPWRPPSEIPVHPRAASDVVPPSTRYFYYCREKGAFFPYVTSCATGWSRVPVAVAPQLVD